MARIRTIKPDFFRHEALFEAEKETGLPLRVAFAGLWTAADREGRFRWSPRALKLDCLPFDDVDFSRVLDALATRGFIVKYRAEGQDYGHIPTWKTHQVINNRENQSVIPEPNDNNTLTRAPRVPDACPTALSNFQGEGKGREGKEDGAVAPPSDEADLFRRGKEVLGPNTGSLVARLLKFKGGSVPLARAVIEQASTKQNPREYVGRVLAGPAKVVDFNGDRIPEGII
jgi:hypothetical protein